MTTSLSPGRSGPDGRAPVDPRLAQANERTMLAWIRTGLALIAFGFVVARLGVWIALASDATGRPGPETTWVGTLFVALGTVANGAAVARYRAARRAIRAGRELDEGPFPWLFAVAVTALGGGLGLYLVLRTL